MFRLKEILLQIILIIKSHFFGNKLRCVLDNTNNINKNDILLFSTIRNEAIRIPYFINYYRNLGVGHFLLVDNGSTDNLMDLVAKEKDISVWFTNESYKEAAFGMHWLNYLLRKYGCSKWCVVCDPDEFLVFPHFEKRCLHELTEFLESENKRSLFCIMLDMYSKRPISETIYSNGQNPLEVAPYFDRTGYVQTPMPSKDTWIQGGVRRRVFFNDCPERSPALNKLPLIKWRWSYGYLSSMHTAVPFFLNQAHDDHHISPTGCILHYKFLSLLQHKSQEELERKEHFDGSFEYTRYNEKLDMNLDSVYDGDFSIKYENCDQLIQLGLMNTGQWF